ncbi:hypothetical protein BaRGS_00020041 [Batillaria attramentaria]|uniref:Secreted protein n=1 Tax=Batillaria attramentaria TaxID=370345 RepID=A0ABD0KNG6_9CAEN
MNSAWLCLCRRCFCSFPLPPRPCCRGKLRGWVKSNPSLPHRTFNAEKVQLTLARPTDHARLLLSPEACVGHVGRWVWGGGFSAVCGTTQSSSMAPGWERLSGRKWKTGPLMGRESIGGAATVSARMTAIDFLLALTSH